MSSKLINNTQTIKMVYPLNTSEKIIGYLISLILFISVVLLYLIPACNNTIVEKNCIIETTKTNPDQNNIIITLLIIGFISAIYSLNGLRFLGFSYKDFSVLFSPGPDGTLNTPNDLKVEFNKTKEENGGGSDTPTAEVVVTHEKKKINEEFLNLSWFEQKILNTLWKYQKVIDHINFNKLWTFTLYENHPEYSQFQNAIRKLLAKEYVFEDKDNNQYALMPKGITLMKSLDSDDLNGIDIYPFNVAPENA